MYMTTGDGLYKSLDGGETWTHLTGVDAEIGYPDGLHLAPDDDQTVFMTGGRRSPGVWRREKKADAGIVSSRDGARTWGPVRGGLPPSLRLRRFRVRLRQLLRLLKRALPGGSLRELAACRRSFHGLRRSGLRGRLRNRIRGGGVRHRRRSEHDDPRYSRKTTHFGSRLCVIPWSGQPQPREALVVGPEFDQVILHPSAFILRDTALPFP